MLVELLSGDCSSKGIEHKIPVLKVGIIQNKSEVKSSLVFQNIPIHSSALLADILCRLAAL